MRRGLLSWDRSEVPPQTLEARVARCQAAMSESGLKALWVYTNFPRPAAVSWLTHFVPYWSQGVLLVPADGAPELFVSLSKRVAGWIAETAHAGSIVSTPRLGAELAKRLETASPIGVVELARLPSGISAPFMDARPRTRLVDASELFRRIRHPADDAEIALSRHAAVIARNAVEEADGDAGALAAAIERAARLAGAEEAMVEISPDAIAPLRRIEGPMRLGERYAVRLSLAYKGHWVRYGRTRAGDDCIGDLVAVMVRQLRDGSGQPEGSGQIGVREMTVEACTGTMPLAKQVPAPPGSIATVNLMLEGTGRVWRESAPVLLSRRREEPALPLA